ncbi:hypothetical protein [Dyella sp.]|jgi:hypothetical protein|uniref:hypothetical protein n=1 Tax=Dyella sp. TaxID=1869338 RepID=UPI002FD92B54
MAAVWVNCVECGDRYLSYAEHRCDGRKPRSLVSTAFTSKVKQLASSCFGVEEKQFLLKEHTSLGFALSATTQILERGSIYDSTLKSVPEDLDEHRKTQLLGLQVGTKGLTVHDDSHGTIVHLLQTQNRVDEMQGTYVHEAMHAYSHDDFKEQFGKDLDEGTTEFFAREIMGKIDPDLLGKRNRVYNHEHALAVTFVDTFGKKDVIDAYFRGDKRIIGLAGAGLRAKPLMSEWRRYKAAMGRETDPPFFQVLGA